MITIVEPKEAIAKLWGKQKVRESDTYRLMRYVLRVDREGKVLLHNVVTGQLVVLSEEEARALDQLPTAYTPMMEQLVSEHYLVPEDYDEHQQVLHLRTLLNRLYDAQCYKGITVYTIFPTTACNARCYYCFEQGVKAVTMSERTADDVVAFISSHCGPERKVFLTWFGGEPTLVPERIDQICLGLSDRGIAFESQMVTNGYLLDEEMVSKAKGLWNLNFVQICVDGTEQNYNRIKSYVYANANPYRRIMENVHYLLDAGISVKLRMNFDVGNYRDYLPFVEEVREEFPDKRLLSVSAHPVIGAYVNQDGLLQHGSDEWFETKIVELNDAPVAGLIKKYDKLPSLNYRICMTASDNAVTVTPDGSLVKCPERFGKDQVIGNVREGVTNFDLVRDWKRTTELEKCRVCPLFPKCVLVANCNTSDKCLYYKEQVFDFSEAMVHHYRVSLNFDRNVGGMVV